MKFQAHVSEEEQRAMRVEETHLQVIVVVAIFTPRGRRICLRPSWFGVYAPDRPTSVLLPGQICISVHP
eukprot:3557072-Rhodomonas_salina.2